MSASKHIWMPRTRPCKLCGGKVVAYLESDYDRFEGKPARVRWWRCMGCRVTALQKIGEARA